MPWFPIELRALNSQRKAMPRISRCPRRPRAETAPHTASHTTSFRHPVHSDLLWKHRDSHTSLLSNCHIVPRLPRKLSLQLHSPIIRRCHLQPNHISTSIILRKAIMPPPRALRFSVKTQGFAHFLTFKLPHCPAPAMFLTFKLAHCPTSATWLTYSSVSYL